MSREHAHSLALERVPDVAVVVVVTGKQDPPRGGECDGGDTAEDVVVGVRVEFAIRPEIEELARGIVGSGRKRIAIGEEPGGVGSARARRQNGDKARRHCCHADADECGGRARCSDSLHRVDIRLVTRERLHCLARPNVPHLCCGVASTRHEQIGVRCQRDATHTRSATSPDQPNPTPLATRHPPPLTHLMTSPV